MVNITKQFYGGAYNTISAEEKEKERNVSIQPIPKQINMSNNSNNNIENNKKTIDKKNKRISEEKLKRFVNFKYL
jgi:hypothetical protein